MISRHVQWWRTSSLRTWEYTTATTALPTGSSSSDDADHATLIRRPRSIAVRATYVPDHLSVSGRPAGPRVGGGASSFSWTAANLPPPPPSMVPLGDRHGSCSVEFGGGRMSMTTTMNWRQLASRVGRRRTRLIVRTAHAAVLLYTVNMRMIYWQSKS